MTKPSTHLHIQPTNSQTQKKKPYNVAIDLLRIISISAVVLIHTTTRTLEASSFDLNRIPWTLFLNQAARFAVPVFFIISGFVLKLNYDNHADYKQFLKKRFSRVLLPYLFWSLIYFFFIFPKHGVQIFSFKFLDMLLIGSASYQLYFIPTLIIFYALFPLLARFIYIFRNFWILILLGIIEVVLLYLDYFHFYLPILQPLRIAALNFFFFIFGAVASQYYSVFKNLLNKTKILLLIVTLGLMYLIYWEGKFFYFQTNNYQMFYSQWRPSIFFYSLSLFSGIYYVLRKLSKEPYIIKLLSRLSFFVFFIHIVILDWVWHNGFVQLLKSTQGHAAEQLWFDPLYFLTVIGISTVIAFAVHKIPKISTITG